MLLGIGDDEAEGKAIAARGFRGLMRRVVEVHTFDRLALDEHRGGGGAQPAGSRCAGARWRPEARTALMPMLTADSGTAVAGDRTAAGDAGEGRSDYVILQLPTGDMTFAESRDTLERFIADVMPKLR